MTFAEVLSYFFSTVAVVAAMYICFGQSTLRVAIAFFIELASVGGVLLSLKADFLALVLFLFGVIGSTLLIIFTNMTADTLKDSTGKSFMSNLVKVLLSSVVGLGTAGIVCWCFLTAPFFTNLKIPEGTKTEDIGKLGNFLLQEHPLVLQIMGVFLVFLAISTGLLLRKPVNSGTRTNAN